jgi:hypothetical protein
MKPLSINFCDSRRGSPWPGRVLLAIAAVVMADAGFSYQAARQAVRESEARFARRTPAAPAAKATPQEVAAARETVERLAMPWDQLFRALESAATDKIALASIEPDAAKGMVTISGEGRDYLAALSYVANLSHAAGIERVQLVRHEHKAHRPNGGPNGGPNNAVSFAVSAAWSAK